MVVLAVANSSGMDFDPSSISSSVNAEADVPFPNMPCGELAGEVDLLLRRRAGAR
jgi:hypothetical protein